MTCPTCGACESAIREREDDYICSACGSTLYNATTEFDMTEKGQVVTDDTDRSWLILYSEDYDNFMVDGQDQVGLLVNQEQARELKRLAEDAIARADND
ncbi:MAG: hypothetical protein HQRvContig01_17 [Haloquadratum phage sp.]|nr:MAG: hypothetical protein HQRvContig01_17 [Haloquadratum phage sp.]